MTAGGARITLCNPTADNWDDFIVANARLAFAHCEANKLNPQPMVFRKGFRPELRYVPKMAQKNSRIGWDLVICGAGPSLRDTWRDHLPLALEKPKADIWATNSALTWILSLGITGPRVYGFGIDQTDGLVAEWAGPPEAKYIIASTVNPKLTTLLQDAGRPITWFHNFVGTKTEAHLYRTEWPGSVMVGDGLNSVNRALCLAAFLGYRRVWVLGADCALQRTAPGEYEMHANGDGALVHGATSVIMTNTVAIAGSPPRTWYTKPDMLFSAVALARQAVVRQGLELVGNTLPHALLDEAFQRGGRQQAAQWLDDVARLERLVGVPAPGGGAERPKGRTMASDLFTVVTDEAAVA